MKNTTVNPHDYAYFTNDCNVEKPRGIGQPYSSSSTHPILQYNRRPKVSYDIKGVA